MTHVSLAISILAVLVAMVTVLGHRTHTEAVLMQARASRPVERVPGAEDSADTIETSDAICCHCSLMRIRQTCRRSSKTTRRTIEKWRWRAG